MRFSPSLLRSAAPLCVLALVFAMHCSSAGSISAPSDAPATEAGSSEESTGDARDGGAGRDARAQDGAAHEAGGKDSGGSDAAFFDGAADAAATSEGGASSDGGKTDGGDAGATAYPTAHLGVNPRSGGVKGDVIRNYSFSGYRATGGFLDTSQLRPIQLADYYDPAGKKGLKVLHIIAAARWSAPDAAEVQAATTLTSKLAAKGAVFLVVMGQGAAFANATKADLDAWVTAYAPHFSMALDPGFAQLSQLWDVSAVPFNVDVDLRSMEILQASVGAPPNLEAAVEEQLDWVAAHPPSWP